MAAAWGAAVEGCGPGGPYKGAWCPPPLLCIPQGSSSSAGAEGGRDMPSSRCTSSNWSCGFSRQRGSPWGPLFAWPRGQGGSKEGHAPQLPEQALP